MATKRDYYEVLGIQRGVPEDEIRRAYRRLARQYHPDVNKEAGAEARFKEVNEAYEVLSDAQKRRMYDQFGHAGVQNVGGAGAAGFGIDLDNIFDTFDTLFGGRTRAGGGRARPQPGPDLRLDLEIDFVDAVFGVTREVEIPRNAACERCQGRGAEPGTEPVKCPECNGSGEFRRVQQSIFGQFVNVTACERCRGEGQIIVTPCSECQGRGEVRITRKLAITIPPGVDDGQQIRLSGEGAPGHRGGPSGDLYVVLSVRPHPEFKRQANDLVYELPINVAQAALGADVAVPTLDHDKPTIDVKIPPGTQHGRTLRVKNMGVPYLRNFGRGDLRVLVRVAVPQQLTDDQRRLFRELHQTFEAAASARAGGDGRDAGGADEVRAGSSDERRNRRPDDARSRGPEGGREGKGIFERVKDFLDVDER